MVQSGAKDEAVERADSGTQPSASLAPVEGYNVGGALSTLKHTEAQRQWQWQWQAGLGGYPAWEWGRRPGQGMDTTY